MNTTFAVLAAAALYLVAALLRLRNHAAPSLVAAMGGLLLAAFAIESVITTPAGLRLGLGPVLALFVWLVTIIHLPLRQRLQLGHLDFPLWLGAAMAIPFGILISDAPAAPVEELSTALRMHILLSLMAWSVLTLAALQTIACAMQSHRLRSHREPLFPQPLLRMEQNSFHLIGIGWVLLVGGIATGFLFVENFLTQHLAHKAALTILASVLFGVLLAGRALRGWRGDQALRWVLGAWVMLFVGYAGVKLILEYGFERSWS